MTPPGSRRSDARSPQLTFSFPEPGDDPARTLERQLAALLRKPVSLHLTDNRRTMISWATRAGVVRLRLHHMFTGAPPTVVEALVSTLTGRGAGAAPTIDEFIEAHRGAIRTDAERTTRRRARLRQAGRCHDLSVILDELNEQLLDGAFSGSVGWGRASQRRRRRSIRLGSYSHADRLIRIHPALDQPFVPRYVVEWVLFHEMLHQLVPIPSSGGRRRCHTREFRSREAGFPDHRRAQAWERENLPRLLRYRGPTSDAANTK